jgi:hypothetical protein
LKMQIAESCSELRFPHRSNVARTPGRVSQNNINATADTPTTPSTSAPNAHGIQERAWQSNEIPVTAVIPVAIAKKDASDNGRRGPPNRRSILPLISDIHSPGPATMLP